MSETELIASAFSSLTQPVLAVRKALIVYMNRPAVELAGKDMTGSPASMLLPLHLLNTQANRFVSTAVIGGRSCSVSVSTAGSHRIFSLDTDVPTVDTGSVMLSELRSSLANIRFISSCISTMAENDGNPKLSEHVASLNRNYHRLKRSMDNISTMNALLRSELPFAPESIDLTELFTELFGTVGFLAGDLDIELRFHSQEHMYIYADRNSLEQLFLNLLTNSFTHCSCGGHISVSLLKTDKSVIVSVDDDGAGIAPEELSGVLMSYRRPPDLSRAYEGTGLGLSIARGIAELHGGTLIIESRGVNKGTSVRVLLSEKSDTAARLRQSGLYYTDRLDRCLTQLSPCLPYSCYTSLLVE